MKMWATTDNLFTNTAPPSELAFTFKGEREIDGFNYLIVSYLTKGYPYLYSAIFTFKWKEWRTVATSTVSNFPSKRQETYSE
jgi:hypothetical protein